jgi:hypothetical protein
MNGLDVRLAAIGTVIQAVLGALVLLDVLDMTAEQIGGVMLAVNAILAAVLVWLSPYIPVVGVKPSSP